MPWKTLTTARGHAYQDWEEPVPGIPPRIVNSIIYLYEDRLDADTGHEAGGSGFLLGMASAVQNYGHIYAVTNAHTIDAGFPVVRVNLKYPSSGNEKTETFVFSRESWIGHEQHDIAVRPFPPDADFRLLEANVLDSSYLMSREEAKSLELCPGDELVYIGRFSRHGGVFKNAPSVRFGNLSMLPDEDEPVEYEEPPGKHRKQVSFLVEARSRSGYSGSPVFLISELTLISPGGKRRRLWPEIGELKILGIDWGHLLEDVEIKPENKMIQVNSGMMGVVPAWYLGEFLRTSPKLIEQRARDDEHYRSLSLRRTAEADNSH